MPDIDPAALSRPAVGVSTPVLSSKTLSGSFSSATKPVKSSQIPARIDLEPLYTELKAAVGLEQWLIYKEATTEFLVGRLNQVEYYNRIDPVLGGPNAEKDHLHNQLIAAIYGNVTREMPDQGLATWVSTNDKPSASGASKPISGDAAERRLKGEVMQLPSKDRRRIKDLVQNDIDPHESIVNAFTDLRRRTGSTQDVPPSSAGAINNMNLDLEIRKRFALSLSVESGEFPDVNTITSRTLPFCYEAGLTSGHTPDAAVLVSVAADTFIKEVLTQIFARTRSNGPGDSGSAGYGVGTNWIQTHKYKKQLHEEEEAAHRGEISRDKAGLLPIEAKAASERGPLGMADMRIALEMADTGMSQFPIVTTQVLSGFRDGELEHWNDYTWLDNQEPKNDGEPLITNGIAQDTLSNVKSDEMDVDTEMVWEGAETGDMDMLDGMLDSCLAVA